MFLGIVASSFRKLAKAFVHFAYPLKPVIHFPRRRCRHALSGAGVGSWGAEDDWTRFVSPIFTDLNIQGILGKPYSGFVFLGMGFVILFVQDTLTFLMVCGRAVPSAFTFLESLHEQCLGFQEPPA